MTQVSSAADCASAKNGGWYHDRDTSSTIAIHLCPCESYEPIDASGTDLVLLNQCDEYVESI